MSDKVESVRQLLQSELKECQNLENTTIKTIGDWTWEVHLQFDKKTALGKDLFVHSLKFKTKNECMIISLNFNPSFNKIV
jgi:hypothetical protein